MTRDIFAARREFLASAAKVLGLGLAVPITGCLFALNPESAMSEPQDELGGIDDNHDHRALITRDQLESGEALTLDITGTSTHPHTVLLSAKDMSAIRAGKHVVVRSTVDWGHDHGVQFNIP